MLSARSKIAKAVVIRPGALGDVLVARNVIALLRRTFPDIHLTLVAPGERGRFLCRPGWADQWLDWERAAFAWLFADGGSPPPAALQAAFAGSDLVLAYADAGAAGLEDRLRQLASGASLLLSPGRPPPEAGRPIGEWLAAHAADFLDRCGFQPEPPAATGSERFSVPGMPPARPYAVIHPGSGSARKNWSLANFAAVAQRCTQTGMDIVVTSGEADGDLGLRLCQAVPGSRHIHQPPLAELAELLASAALYIGNDSGVSHLASAVENAAGQYPDMAVIFGPSDPAVWSPPGALVLQAGGAMGDLSPESAWSRIQATFQLQSPPDAVS